MTLLMIISIVAMILSFIGNLMVNFKNKTGFIIWTASNLFWIAVNFMSPQPNIPQVIMFLSYIGLNIHGYWNWTKKEK